jgi:hypothetical protein
MSKRIGNNPLLTWRDGSTPSDNSAGFTRAVKVRVSTQVARSIQTVCHPAVRELLR